MANFGLVKSFDIDNGELDGLRRSDCFVLGYELAQIDSQLQDAATIARLIHAENRERVAKSCADANRDYTISWMPNDPSESWLMLNVKKRSEK